MASFIVEGGHRLHGSITPAGAKNEALQVLSAVLLTSAEVVIDNLPDILDVNNLIDLLAMMGVRVQRDGKRCAFCAEHIDTAFLESPDFLHRCNRLRGSVMLIVDHIINGEVTWRYPFFTALEEAGGLQVMLREMLTVGVPMSIVLTAVWVGYAILKERKNRITVTNVK